MGNSCYLIFLCLYIMFILSEKTMHTNSNSKSNNSTTNTVASKSHCFFEQKVSQQPQMSDNHQNFSFHMLFMFSSSASREISCIFIILFKTEMNRFGSEILHSLSAVCSVNSPKVVNLTMSLISTLWSGFQKRKSKIIGYILWTAQNVW